VNDANSFLLPVDDIEKAFDSKWFHGQGNWGVLNEKHITIMGNCMRDTHSMSIGDNVNNEGIATAKQLTWAKAVKKLLEIL
jgi:hypothetical protein